MSYDRQKYLREKADPHHRERWRKKRRRKKQKRYFKFIAKVLRYKYKVSITARDLWKIANKIHHSKYDYSGVIYTKTSHPVTIICPIHGKFLQAPAYHLLGQGCPRCRISKGETRIESFLTSHQIVYSPQKSFIDCRDVRPLKFDFYIPSENLLIEYDGEQHFRRGKMGKHYVSATELREVQRRDCIKTDYAKRRDIRLLRIAYTEFSRIDEILMTTFNQIGVDFL